MTTNASGIYLKIVTAAIAVVMIVSFSLAIYTSTPSITSSGSVNAPFISYSQPVLKDQWINYSTSTGPAPMSNSTMSCFEPSSEVILFGGEYMANVTSGTGKNVTYKNVMEYSNSTWAYSSGVWSSVKTGSSIPQMAGSASAYDAPAKSVVLFGGENNTTLYNQTWIYTGFTWTPLKLAVAPSARVDASMAYSSALNGVVLFGGQTSTGYSNSTWIFKGGAWQKLSGAGIIPAMSGSALGSTGNGNLVLYGGFNGTAYSSATYIFNVGSMKWSKIVESVSPPALAFAHLNYFSYNNVTVLFGGVSSTGTPYSGTWIFNNTSSWDNIWATAPYAAYGQAMTHYSANNTIVLFGGTESNAVSEYNNYTFQFMNNTFNWVLFKETGLPANSTWGVKVGSSYNNTTSSAVGFLVLQGTYNYTVFSPSGYQASTGTNFTMYFSETNVSISFSKTPGLLYYSYGAIAGIAIVILALVGEVVYRKIFK